MRSPIHENHFSDSAGRPAGGSTYGQGFAIGWQNGPLAVDGMRAEPNGAFVEDIIAAAIDRIEFYQRSEFECDENADALLYLQRAAGRLDDRTKERETRAVEGTHSA